MSLDWAYLAHVRGGELEHLAALLLRRRYGDTRRVNPSQGDGGVDVVRETADGLMVWQIKQFSTPLSPSQRSQVKRSWAAFTDTHVRGGASIASYSLVTIWEPTEEALRWWRAEVVADAAFPVTWDGSLLFDELAADCPEVVDRFVKGADMLEQNVTAKAILAASPVEVGSPFSMLDALSRRQAAMAEIRDLISDNYRIDTAVVTTGSSEIPPIGQLRSNAAYHRMTYLAQGRWQIDSLLPRDPESVREDPITVRFEADVTPGSSEAEQLLAWRAWGVPLTEFDARVSQVGGPFGSGEWHDSVVSIVTHEEETRAVRDLPDLVMCDESGDLRVRFRMVARSRGAEGRGLRLVATTRSGIFTVEVRVGSPLAPDAFSLRLEPCAGLVPALVGRDLATLSAIGASGRFEVRVEEDGSRVVVGTALDGPATAGDVAEIAGALVTLSGHTRQSLTMPDLSVITVGEVRDLLAYAGALTGVPIRTTWTEATFTVSDPAALAASWAGKQDGYLVEQFYPELSCGTFTIRLDTPFARTVRVPPLPAGLARLPPSSEVVFGPGDDDTMTVSVLDG